MLHFIVFRVRGHMAKGMNANRKKHRMSEITAPWHVHLQDAHELKC